MTRIHLLCLMFAPFAVSGLGCGRSSSPPTLKQSELSYLLKGVEDARIKHGDDHSRTLTLLSSLADWYERKGRYEDAIHVHQERTDILRRKYGSDYSYTLSSIENMARLQTKQGNYETAAITLGRVLDARKRVAGAEHADTLRSIEQLADVLLLQSKYDDAQQHLLELFRISRDLHGDDDPRTLSACDRLIAMYDASGNDSELAKWKARRAEPAADSETEASHVENVK